MPTIANDAQTIAAMQADPKLAALRREMYQAIARYRYTYNFSWYDRPIIQLPEDIVAMQELILSSRPDLIVETGVAHGGSLVLSASMLELLGEGEVVGVDIDIRAHNRVALEAHPLFRRIRLIEGSSIDADVARAVHALAAGKQRVMVLLDSNHTHDHVLAELRLYAPLVRAGGHLVVFDTGIDDLPDGAYPDRPWGPGNNPKTAVRAFLAECDRFVVNRELEARLMYTAAPEGYLLCVRDPA